MIRPINLLLVENDKDLSIIMRNYFIDNGHLTKICEDKHQALLAFSNEKFDFIIIDTAISLTDSLDLVAKIRRISKELPIIIIGTNSQPSDIILCFKMGADDFISNPFSMEELGLRIKAIQKRIHIAEQNRHLFKIGQYTLDTLHHVLIFDGKEKKLTTKELDLLYLFCEYKNRVVERKLALKKVWHQENYFSARNMDVYIKRLRNMLADDPNVQLENVHGVGYILIIHGL